MFHHHCLAYILFLFFLLRHSASTSRNALPTPKCDHLSAAHPLCSAPGVDHLSAACIPGAQHQGSLPSVSDVRLRAQSSSQLGCRHGALLRRSTGTQLQNSAKEQKETDCPPAFRLRRQAACSKQQPTWPPPWRACKAKNWYTSPELRQLACMYRTSDRA